MVSRRRRPFELLILALALALGVSLLAGLGRDTGDSADPGFDGGGRIVIRNVSLVLTMDPELGEGPLGRLADADVLIDRDRISAVGKDLPDDGARVLDGHGKIVLPGFVDVHNHLWQALIRGCATDQELNGWLGGCVRPLFGPSISGADGYAGARMATLGGAEVLGLDDETGSLTPGKKADVQLINPVAVGFAPEFDWISQLVFNAQPANVEWVFVSGRALKRDGRIVGDQGRVIADAQAASDRVQKLLGRNAHPGGR